MQANLRDALEPHLDGRYHIETWLSDDVQARYGAFRDATDNESNADEDIWYRFFKSEPGVAMVVADHDLSGYGSVRISESAVADACRQAAIPICTYHRAPSAKSASQSLRGIYGQTKSFSISLDMSPGNEVAAARNIVSLADGFEYIRSKFTYVSPEIKQQGPAAILAEILGRSGLANSFALYAAGPTLASDAIYHISQNSDNYQHVTYDLDERLPFILGCWLNNYILPFPGLILNSKATASYLNIAIEEFMRYADYFKTAEYDGPFAGIERYWWRTDLDQMLIDLDFEDGRELLKGSGIEVFPCLCANTHTSPAGYYCIVRKQPISLDASVGNLGWIPQGAHLSRIDQDIYDTVAHMMGI